MNGTTKAANNPSGKLILPLSSLENELGAIKTDLDKAIVLAQRGQAGFSRGGANLSEIIQELKQISACDPREMSARLSQLLDRLGLQNSGDYLGHSVPMMPPVVFHRVAKLSTPIVNREAIEEAVLADTEPEGLEGFLDNMFSNDRIYDDIIRKLRAQIIALDQRNGVLESNLDLADSEITYWRQNYKEDKPLRATSPKPPKVVGRTISEKAWKLSISKFIGAADQFILMKTLFQWRMYITCKKSKSLVNTN